MTNELRLRILLLEIEMDRFAPIYDKTIKKRVEIFYHQNEYVNYVIVKHMKMNFILYFYV